jgi:hypothetical protein
MSQAPLFDRYNAAPAFSGATFDQELDEARLTSQLARVRKLMSDGRWRTLAHIAQLVRGSEAGVSARLRQLRSLGHQVDRQRRGDPKKGVWIYRCEAKR